MILPIIMFSWTLIDVNYKIFSFIAYSLFFFEILIKFIDSMYGIAYDKPYPTPYLPWYYVLDNSDNFDLFYEIFMIWIITF